MSRIEDLKCDIQEIESCLAQGFTLNDWLWCKRKELARVEGLPKVIVIGGRSAARKSIAATLAATDAMVVVSDVARESINKIRSIKPSTIDFLSTDKNQPDGWYRKFEKRNKRNHLKSK